MNPTYAQLAERLDAALVKVCELETELAWERGEVHQESGSL